jgi:hypothetical protein
VPLTVALCAAALVSADKKLPSPMALAQAEALAQVPDVGPVLMSIQENFNEQLGREPAFHINRLCLFCATWWLKECD